MLFTSIARALVKHVGNLIGFGVAGSAVEEIWNKGNDSTANERKKLDEIKMIVGMSEAAARENAVPAVKEVAGDRPEKEQQALVAYLTQVPNAIRQSQRRPNDPSGRTVSSALRLDGPEDLARL